MAPYDIAVLGSGPAGTAAAAACAARGLRTVLVAPAPDAAWEPTYGSWADELAELGDDAVAGSVAAAFPDARVGFGGGRGLTLPRPYVRIDAARLQRVLADRTAGVDRRVAAVHTLVHDADGTTVHHDGGTLTARVVIDATGHAPRFVQRPGAAARCFQAAYGLRIEGTAPDGFVFMDFDAAHLDPADAGPPTFLYAQPLPDGQAFYEETSLAADPAVPFEVLKQRLLRRLRSRGVVIHRVLDEERCLLPMDPPLPRLDQRVVGFGAAASFLHPASGYALVRSLASAASLADALSAHLDAGPQAAAGAAWAALWPAARVRTRRLHEFGLYSLARMSPARTREFFAAFFALPSDSQRAFLADTLSAGQLASVMTALFVEAPPRVRWALLTGGASAGSSLVRAVAGA